MFDERGPAEPELTPDLKAIEGRLARLVPAGARVDRDRLMYEAGRAAKCAASEPCPSPSLQGRGNVWVWRGMSAFMTAASLMLGTMLVWQRHGYEVALERQNHMALTVQVAQQPSASILHDDVRPDIATANRLALRQANNGYLGIRYAALTRGINEMEFEDQRLNSIDSMSDSPQTQREMLNEMLPAGNNKAHSRS